MRFIVALGLGSLHIGKQHVNARKAPVRVWQLGNSAAADGGLIGGRLIDGNVVFVCQIGGANRESQRNGYDHRNDEFQSNPFVGHRGYSL